MTENLTPAQRIAVENRGGELLVSAAAGSGKTKVLVDRLMSYLTDPTAPANIDDFLIITYTKAAAAELRGKIAEKLTLHISEHPENKHMQQQIQRLYLAKISTVHAFCADILREYAYRLDLSADFRIAEENECTELMLQAMDDVLEDAYSNRTDNEAFCAFVDTQGLGRDDRQVAEIILQIHTNALCHLNPEQWLNWCKDMCDLNDVTDASETLWGSYLIQDLKDFLVLQIKSLENCVNRAAAVDGMEKPVSLLSATVCDLKSLLNCCTWDAIVNHPPVNYGTLTFKKELKDSLLAEQIKAIRNACKDGLSKKLRSFTSTSSVVLDYLRQTNLATEGLIHLVEAFRIQYDKMKRSRRVLDFSDIEQKMLDLLYGKQRGGITATAEEIALRFREVLVDEYQDSNEVQDAIFAALTQRRHNCFMVGDVKQSIYQFRLADPGIFLQKYNAYLPAHEAEPAKGRKVMLSSNFRSSIGVISAVNDVFSCCMSKRVGGLEYGEQERLYEGIPHIPLSEPEVQLYCIDVNEDTYEEEARCVAQQVCQLLDGKHMIRRDGGLSPITAADIVILLRSPGSVGAEFQFALEQQGISCTMGNDSDLLCAPEVDTVRALLQIIQNPFQDIPLIAVLSSPIFGFTADDLAMVRSPKKHGTFYSALQISELPKVRHFLDVLQQLRKHCRFLTVSQLIHKCFAMTQMLSIYGAMEDGVTRVHNLQSFCQIAVAYENTGRKDLASFLEYMDTMQQKGLPISSGSSVDTVRIMSIHKSKGLEFPVVFLCGLSRAFNLSDTQKAVLCHKELGLGLNCVNQKQRTRFPSLAKRAIAVKITEECLSEELRVLYVAMTRARDRLILTYAAKNLSDRLRDITLRLDLSERELLTSGVHCPGNWVLQTALRRTEAGALFQLAGYPESICVQEYPWDIRVSHASSTISVAVTQEQGNTPIHSDVIQKMQRGLRFQYPYLAATHTPSKLTATQLKGRTKDMEAAEFAENASNIPYLFRAPTDLTKQVSGTDYGNAMHAAMQYLDFSACTCCDAIYEHLQLLQDRGLLTAEQVRLVDASRIMDFVQSDLGQRIQNAKHVLREFKFSILEDAQAFIAECDGDKVLLQGVIDCAVIEDAGITVVDFKTDRVTEKTAAEKALQYESQIRVYAAALSKIYKKPVNAAYLYFFSIGRAIQIL